MVNEMHHNAWQVKDADHPSHDQVNRFRPKIEMSRHSVFEF